MHNPIYFFANWKMYLSHDESVALARSFAEELGELSPAKRVVLFPSALALAGVSEAVARSALQTGAQNTYWVAKGGVTGEISAEMAAGVGARYVLVGHSERRHLFKESNHEVRQKLEAALAAGLTPVLCVGDTLHEHEAGEADEVIEAQVRSALMDLVWPSDVQLIVAYEPVWAISKGPGHDEVGLYCDPKEAGQMAEKLVRMIAGLLPGNAPIILFGGSVRPHNVRAYLAEPHLAGVLVGAAATKLESWREIVNAV